MNASLSNKLPHKLNSTVPEVVESSSFLPNFCTLKMVFTVVIIGELLAFILTLAPLDMEQQRWNDLALISLYIQWNGLTGSGLLCLLRPLFKNQSEKFIAVSSYFVLLLVIVFFSELSFFIMAYYQITNVVFPATHWEFLLHNLLIGSIISALALRYFYIQHQWRLKMQTENSTKLQLLQARIRPHFLFNSMNTIASLTRTRPELAERITEDLAELFRMLFREDHEMIPWKRELLLSERYVEIEKLRLGERLSLNWYVDDIPDDAMLPALLLQPLLENAIFHGVEPEITGGTIMITGKLKKNRLKIKVQNSNSKNLISRQGNKMALDNIKERLMAHFFDNATIECYEKDDNYFVLLDMPYQK